MDSTGGHPPHIGYVQQAVKEMFNIFNYESTNMKDLPKLHHIAVKLHVAGRTVFESDPVARLLQSLPSDNNPPQAIRLSVNEVNVAKTDRSHTRWSTTHWIENDKAEVLDRSKASKPEKAQVDKKDVKC